MSAKVGPIYPANGNLRMYHMNPYRRYVGDLGIDGMIDYVPQIAEMGYNAIWGGPFQDTGNMPQRHPDGQSDVSGSLYAMADDREFNPLIFPGCESRQKAEEKLKQWTATVRLNGMFPLFDLVLNHVGRHAGDALTPLQIKLGAGTTASLLLPDISEDWPDIQLIDYYKTGCRRRGVNIIPDDLDPEKIEAIFQRLWQPFIDYYIDELGFMGVRVDAITHVPVSVQQRAYQYIQERVFDKYGTNAIIVGEFMVYKPEDYTEALSACGFTHVYHPCSFFWGHNQAGGYDNREEGSPFIKQAQDLPKIVLPPVSPNLGAYKNLIIDPQEKDFNFGGKLQAHTIYIYKENGTDYVRLNAESTDICWGKAVQLPLSTLESDLPKLASHLCTYRKEKNRAVKHKILEWMLASETLKNRVTAQAVQLNRGGLIGVIGNHDVGTLRAKTMLDIAFSRAMSKEGWNTESKVRIEEKYKRFKNATIRGVRDEHELLRLLENEFNLSKPDTTQLCLDLELRLREKIFIQAMMCFGGWYSLAGDEIGVCQKPEVFREFALNPSRVGPALSDSLTTSPLPKFIKGINAVLSKMPQASADDHASMHYSVLDWEEFEKKAAKFLFIVVRYSAIKDEFTVIGHVDEHLPEDLLKTKIVETLSGVSYLTQGDCKLHMIDRHGKVVSGKLQRNVTVTFSETCQPHSVSDSEQSTPSTGKSAYGASWNLLLKGKTLFFAPRFFVDPLSRQTIAGRAAAPLYNPLEP